MAKALLERGYSLWALDHRGHGRSDGKRAVIDRIDNAVADMRTLIDMVTAEAAGTKPVLLGHSMGGLLSLAYTLRNQETIHALALSAPLAALEAASPVTLMISSVLSAVAPTLGVFGVDASGVSRDPDVVRDYETDPLVFHGKLPVRTIAELAGEIGTLPERVPEISLPLLLMYGTADTLAPPAGSEMLRDGVGSLDKSVTPYAGLYHEIFNEPERDQVIAELTGWLDSHTS